MTPRVFVLHRTADPSGVSGTGTVAYGTEYPDGAVSVRWLGERASWVLHDSIDNVIAIHGHNGATRIVWLTGGDDAERRLTAVREAVTSFCHGEQAYVEHMHYCVPILTALDGAP